MKCDVCGEELICTEVMQGACGAIRSYECFNCREGES